MPTVRLNHDLRQKLLDRWTAKLGDRVPREWDPAAVHRSDLDRCIRASYFQYTAAPFEHTASTLLVFLRGKVLQSILLTGDDTEFEEVIEGITSHVDERIDGDDLEMKTARAKYTEPPDFGILTKDKKGTLKAPWGQSWMMEAAWVAAKRDDRTCNFMVLHLNGDYQTNRDWMLAGPYAYTFTEAECAIAREWFAHRRVALMSGMAVGEPPPVNYRLGDWECENCPFKSLCVDDLSSPGSESYNIPVFEMEGL